MTADPSRLSISRLLGSMTVGQVWAFAAAIFGLLAGSFTAGYQVSESLHVKSARDVTGLEDEVKGTAEKNRFLALYLRFMLAKDKLDLSAYNANAREHFETTRDALDGFVGERVDSESLVLHKGGSLATIRFKDGTTWELPPEIHMVEEL